MKAKIELKEYYANDCIESASSIDDVCSDVLEYSDYISDAISEVADQSVEIYNSSLWKSAPDFKEYIEEAFEEGLIDPSAKDFTLERAFMAGQYLYYQQQLYDNLDTIIFNYAATYYNNHETEKELTAEQLEEALAGIDHNDRFDAIEDAVNELLEQ